MKQRLGADDVLLQVALTAVVHWAWQPEWIAHEFLARCGFVVPVALVVVALFRAMCECRAIE